MEPQYHLFKSDVRDLCEGLSHDEFKCQCNHASCKFTPIRPELVAAYCKFRKALQVPLKINSGYRCPYHNNFIGGTPRSFHQVGLAIDIAYVDALTHYTSDQVLKVATDSGFQFTYFDQHKMFFHLQVIRG